MGTTNFDKIKADEANVGVVRIGGVQVTATPTSLNALLYDPGQRSMAVIDFNATAEAGCKITIGGVDYPEKDVPDPTKGEWTNGASAADSATSFAAGVNGKTGGLFGAVVSDAGESVIIVAKAAGAAGNVAISTTSAGNVTVETPARGGRDAAARRLLVVNLAVTAQDILAEEVNVPLPGAPIAWTVQYRDATGAAKAATWTAAVTANPARLTITKAGVTDLIATDVVVVTAII